ncbi:hypothetical protein DFJ67_5504 [Asanoa ferruginea]|uniref:Dolichyl-phosphate-mannose-protein mannosyltransferase n=1 Tax=Asanoa ferruginea TaxID=53367 RepID=A0A3D9ZQ26_9ACTN|nr:hypothetical protein DFJ67_5504 [Asanoa ferruginea]GIF49400.1 hypothetical protein Afe04nite_39390 [Asanoa ferruginea]
MTGEKPADLTPGDHPTPRLGDWSYRILLALLLGTGIAGVTRVWWAGMGMWKDEAGIANNLLRSYTQLTAHLTYDQVAPVGWLWLEKTLLEQIGSDDRVLRVPAYLGTLTVFCLGTWIARRAIGRAGAVVVAALLVLSPMLWVYAAEVKQYAWEAGIALCLLVLAAWAHEALRWTGIQAAIRGWWRPVLWVAVTAVAVCVSFSAILVVAAITVALAGLHLLRRARADAGWLALLSAPAGVAAAYLVYRRHQYSFYPHQTDYFIGGTAPAGAGPGEFLRWFPFMWGKFVTAPMSWQLPALVLVFMLVGVVALWRRDRLWSALLVMVFLAGVGGGAVRGFPVVARPAMYLIAPAVLLVVAGLDGLVRASVALFRRRRALVATVTSLVLLTGVAAIARPGAELVPQEFAHPLGKDGLAAGLADIAPLIQPGDKVLVYYFGNAVTTWYKPLLGIDTGVYHVRVCQVDKPDAKERQLYDLIGDAKRVFYLQGQLSNVSPKDQFEISMRALGAMGTVKERHESPNDRIGPHSWALVELHQVPPVPRPTRTGDPCLEIY